MLKHNHRLSLCCTENCPVWRLHDNAKKLLEVAEIYLKSYGEEGAAELEEIIDKISKNKSAPAITEGRLLAKARDKFFQENPDLFEVASLYRIESMPYLKNRLEKTFIAGWNAAIDFVGGLDGTARKI